LVFKAGVFSLPGMADLSVMAASSLVVLLSASTRASDISSLAFSPLVGPFVGTTVLFDIDILSVFLSPPAISGGWVSAVPSDVLDKTVWSPGWPLDVSGRTIFGPGWPLDVSGKTVLSPS